MSTHYNFEIVFLLEGKKGGGREEGNIRLLTMNSRIKLSVTWNYSENILSTCSKKKISFGSPTLSSSENSEQLINVS